MACKAAVHGEFDTVMHIHSNPAHSTNSPVSTTSEHADYAACFFCSCRAHNPSQMMNECNIPNDSHCSYLNAKPAQAMSKAVSYKLTVLYCLVQEALVKKAELDKQKHVLLEKQVAQQKVRNVA